MNTTNVLGVGSNSVTFTTPDTTVFNLSVLGQPLGLTTVLSTNVATNTIPLALNLFATNVAAGAYSLSLNGSGGSYPSFSTNVNLFVVPQWIITNNTANWSSGSSWSGGSAPVSSDSVYIENQTGGFTNVVDTTTSIKDLVILGDKDANLVAGTVSSMQIPTGVTLSVLGTNGFVIGTKSNNSTRPWYDFSGAGAMVVSNTLANFVVNDGCSGSSTRATTVTMSNLNTMSVTVNRFGIGDATLSAQGLIGGANVIMSLAMTNTIKTVWSDNYSALNFQNAFNFGNNGEQASGSVTTFLNLGLTNGIYTDSIGVGRSHLQGSSGVGATMRFNPLLSNYVSLASSVYIRGTNGGRMPFMAVGVDSGSANSTKNTIGLVDLRGGKVDISVDKIWLGSNRTNTVNPIDTGGLSFDSGTVNANIIEAGYMQYTNGATVKGTVLVGTNGVLMVNTNLELGHTPAVIAGFETAVGNCSGQVTINNGGTIRASQITVGQFSTNNTITINNGGNLDVTNTVASSTKYLSSLTAAGGGLTLHITGNNTTVYVSNLTASGSSPINIASVSGISSFPATISVVKYASATTPNNWVGGTGPAGLTVGVANNSGNNSIDVTLSTGTPKTLLWKGYVDNTWNSSTKNWLDVSTGLHTNFAALDFAIFDDTASSTSVNVTEDVVPSQTGTGISMTNNTSAYTFTGSGRVLGGSTFAKYGTNNMTVDLYTEFGINVNTGSLSVTANGTIGSASVAAGAAAANAGNVLGSITSSGFTYNSGTVIGSASVRSFGIITNASNINGSLSMQTNSLFYNGGTLSSIGSATITTNSIFVNAGTIYGSTLTVNVGGTLIDTVAGSSGFSPGSFNVGTLAISGAFYPGGTDNTITTTKVTDYDLAGDQQGIPNGRIQLSAGSVTLLKVNLTNSQPYTKILSQSLVLGPSQNFKAFNGSTLIISNIGPTAFAAGQTFKMFGAYYTDGNIGSAGPNTTNSFPIIIPNTPGPGLVWDLSQLYMQGNIGVLSANDPSLIYYLTNQTVVDISNTNVVTHFSWPSDKMGGWIQQLNTTLTNGLSATNWITPSGGYLTNMSSLTDIYITNTFVANPTNPGSAVFFRFVYP